jgi:hypothetical protein
MERLRLPEKTKKASKSTILTRELRKRFCHLVRKGLPPDNACNFLGISNTTFWDWVNKGNKYNNGGHEPAEYRVYGRFIRKFRKATAIYLYGHVKRVGKKKKGEWYKHLAILERRDRKTWGRHEPDGGAPESFIPDEKFI